MPVDALELVQAQHEQVDELISQLEDDALPVDRKRAVLHELASQLVAHAAMEELLFYPAVRAKQTEEILLDPADEHLALRRALSELMHTPLGEPPFEARLAVLKEEFDHHAHEEEEEVLFPELRQLMTEDELVTLGREMRSVFERLVGRVPSREASPEPDVPTML